MAVHTILLSLCLMAVLSAASAAAPPEGCQLCDLAYSPVCKDGIEYQNECIALCQGIYNAGRCQVAGAMQSGMQMLSATLQSASDNQHTYVTEGTVTWPEMSEMAAQGYVFTGRGRLAEWRQQERKHYSAEDLQQLHTKYITSSSSSSSTAQQQGKQQQEPGRRHVIVTYPGGNVYVQSTPHALPAGNPRHHTQPSHFAANSTTETSSTTTTTTGASKHHRRLQAINGPDDRVEITEDLKPTTAVALFANPVGDYLYTCSAALISPSVALTAAHCIFDNDTKQFFDVGPMRVIPSMHSGGVDSFGSSSITRAVTYKAFTEDGDPSFDVAVLYLNRSFSAAGVGYFLTGYECGDNTYDLTTAGYPGDMPQATMWMSRCSINTEMCVNDLILHTCDSASGQSGSGMWTTEQEDTHTIRMVHTCTAETTTGRKISCGASLRPQTYTIIDEATGGGQQQPPSNRPPMPGRRTPPGPRSQPPLPPPSRGCIQLPSGPRCISDIVPPVGPFFTSASRQAAPALGATLLLACLIVAIASSLRLYV